MDREQTIAVWDGGVRMRVLSAGAGPALVFLHGPWGLVWDSFLDDLARSFTVYAPEHPGTTPQAHDDIYRLDGLWDLDPLMRSVAIRSAIRCRARCTASSVTGRCANCAMLFDGFETPPDDPPVNAVLRRCRPS